MMSVVDLHTHTTESDGTLSPPQLIEAAAAAGVRVLAITDHDTVAAHGQAASAAASAGIELIRGIEITTRYGQHPVHLLGYFFGGPPGRQFDQWLDELLEGRRDRNARLSARLCEFNVPVSVEEAEQFGQPLTGRVHFARAMVAKGYVGTMREAFDRYLGEEGAAYVERAAPPVAEAIAQIHRAGGVSSLAHPSRLPFDSPDAEQAAIASIAAAGLTALEAFHADHEAPQAERYLALARQYRLAVSGGSDFHGAYKPGVVLGHYASGSLPVPDWIVPELRARTR